MNYQQAQDKIAQILALPFPAEGELQVMLDGEYLLGTRFSDCAISQNTLKQQTDLRLSARLGQKRASIDLNTVDDLETIQQALGQVFETCLHMPDDEELMPAVGEVLESHEYAFDVRTEVLEIEDIGRWVAQACAKGRKAEVDLAGLLSLSKDFRAYGDSAGGFAFERSHRVDYHVTATGENGSGWAEVQGVHIDESTLMTATQRAIRKCKAAQQPRVYTPRPTTVILEPQAVGELISMAFWYGFDQRATDEGRSAFAEFKETLGEVTLFSDPANTVFPALSFSAGAQAVRKTEWLKQGQLTQLPTRRYWAKHKDIAACPQPNNLILAGHGTALEDMIKSTEDGILVTRFWYIRSTDPKTLGFTGMTRDGTFRIKNGKLTHPVMDMRWNESVLRVFQHIIDSGEAEATGEFFNMAMPALKVEGFQFTSLSGD